MKTIPKHTIDFIDSWLSLRYKWAEYPGFVVAIYKDGKVAFNKAYGFSDVDKKQKLTSDHSFRIASHSKTFTATAVMQLQEAGRLRIDDAVVDYAPWLKAHRDKRWKDVTIRQLLSHSAGIIRDGLNSNYWHLEGEFPDAETLKKNVLEADLVLEPNTKMKYSNYGYSLLGMVVENASNKSYGDYVRENIIEPLGLKNTACEFAEAKNLATGYSRQTIKKKRYAFPDVPTHAMAPATGFCSTSSDLCIYFSALIVGSGKLLKDTSKREMQRKAWEVEKAQGEAYGLGLDVVKFDGRNLIGHSGGFPGFVTRTWCDTEDKLVVSVLTNAHGTMPSVMAKSIIGIIGEFGDQPPKESLKRYEVRLGSLHGAYEVIAHAGGLRGIYPNGWFPLDSIDKLEVIDDKTVKVVDTSSFNDLGELGQYTFSKEGKVESVVFGGSHMKPTVDDDLVRTWT